MLRHVFAWAECAELRLWRIVLGCSPLAAHHHDHRRPGVNRFYRGEPAQVVHPRSCLLPTHTHTNPQCNVHVCTHIPTVHCLRLPSSPAVQWRLFTLEQSPVTSHHLPPPTSHQPPARGDQVPDLLIMCGGRPGKMKHSEYFSLCHFINIKQSWRVLTWRGFVIY